MLTTALIFIAVGVNAQTLDDIISKEKTHPKIEGNLKRLHDQHKQAPSAARKEAQKKDIPVDAQDKVIVFIMAEPGKTADSIDKDALEFYGVEIIKSAGGVMKAKVPIDLIQEIAENVRGVSYIQLPDRPQSQYYKSEGVALTGAAAFQTAGYTGSGVKVAVMDSFAGLFSAVQQGELPATLTAVNCTGPSCVVVPSPYNNMGAEPHGTAVAEIIHDMAPGAQLYLIRTDDPQDLITAKDFCIAQGIRIINFSVGLSNTNFYDGKCWSYYQNPVCTVNDAYNHGILWVNSAGNYANKHYSAVYTDQNNSGLHDQGIIIIAYAGETIKI